MRLGLAVLVVAGAILTVLATNINEPVLESSERGFIMLGQEKRIEEKQAPQDRGREVPTIRRGGSAVAAEPVRRNSGVDDARSTQKAEVKSNTLHPDVYLDPEYIEVGSGEGASVYHIGEYIDPEVVSN